MGLAGRSLQVPENIRGATLHRVIEDVGELDLLGVQCDLL